MAQLHNAAAALSEEEPAAGDPQREFAFSESDFQELKRLAFAHAGISLSDSKRNLVYSRLSRRLRALGLNSFRHYTDYLAAHDGEAQHFINAISTNLTKFFRESHHLDHFLSDVVAPFAETCRHARGRRFRVWSAGCSTGEEAYSIAMTLRGGLPDINRQDVRILATDIDTNVLTRGISGEYPSQAAGDIPGGYHEHLCFGANRRAAESFTMADSLRSLITFRHLNLLGPWPFQGLFDAIFCRNVMIYFDGPTKATLVDRFTKQIKPGGWLYIGHAETLIGPHPDLIPMGRTIYRRRG